MRWLEFALAICCILTVLSCNSREWGTNDEGVEPQYVIRPDVPDSATGTDWFNVVDIDTDVSQGVPAVVQLSGFVYLPIHSHPPTFDDKVVSGIFVPDTNYHYDMTDTVFRVTKHLRDTTLAGWGYGGRIEPD